MAEADITDTAAHRTLIIGLGQTGMSCARYLRSVGRPFRVMDSRFSPPLLASFRRAFPDNEPILGGFHRDEILAADEIVVSPGISLSTPEIAEALERGARVIGDIDIFSRHVETPVAAVTGSNGKSTVVTLLGEMARADDLNVGVGGNLDGRASMPALDLLRGGPHQLYVLELSSFQLETTDHLGARAAVVLNLSEDHLDRYADMAEYREAKLRIFRGCHTAVINRDEAVVDEHGLSVERVLRFGTGAPERADDYGVIEHQGQRWIARGSSPLLPVSALRLVGQHNLSNVLAALALGEAVGLSQKAMQGAARRFRGLPHRCQWLGEHRGATWYNDSKATNVAAARGALASVGSACDGRVVWIAGGVGKGADFRSLKEPVRRHARAAILMGQDAGQLEEALEGVVPVSHAASMEEAVDRAAGLVEPGDAVLLSPACASLDMFRDFAERGRVFSAAVEALQ